MSISAREDRRRWTFMATLLLFSVVASPSAQANGLSADLFNGQFIYQIRCAGCHGSHPSGIARAASLVQVDGRAAGTITHGGSPAPFRDINTADLAAWISAQDFRSYRLAGFVTDTQGNPRSNIRVTVCSTYLGYAPVETVTDLDGYFRVDGLPPGDHVVTPSAPSLEFAPTNWITTVHELIPFEDDLAFIAYGTNEPPPTTHPPGPVQRVSPDGDDLHDGRSWATARQTVGAALSVIPPGGEVWVAEGIYYETITVSGRAVFGGFTGTERRRGQRDWRLHPTILDGDPSILIALGLPYGTVVTLAGAGTNSASLDGLVIQNGAADFGGGIMVTPDATPLITHCRVRRNIAFGEGGGIFCNDGSTAVIVGNVLEDNSAIYGGALRLTTDSTPRLIANNLFLRNSADQAAAIAADGMIGLLANNTIVQNISGAGGVLYFIDGSGTMANNLIAFNSAGIDDNGPPAVWRHNNAFGNANGDWVSTSPDPTDISADPLFLDAAGDDFHLRPGSPCLEAGDDAAAQTDDRDLDDRPRRQRAHVDIGAYELPPPSLAATRQDGKLLLSWPKAETGFQLEHAASLVSPIWLPAGSPIVNGSDWSMTVPATDGLGVFRLRQP